MGRYKKPIELHRLSGAERKNPKRYQGEVPKSDMPFGEYPTVHSTDPAECWQEIAAECIPGILTGSDRIMMEIAANLLAEYRTDPPAFPVGKYRHLVGCFSRFGMSPSDRAGLGVVESDDDDEYKPISRHDPL